VLLSITPAPTGRGRGQDELQRLDKLCGNGVLHRGFSDFWTSLPDAKKRTLLQITMDEVRPP
jgi:hypothetical protein